MTDFILFVAVYQQDGTHDGRPVYRELRKISDTHFERKVGATIKYCESEGAWVFSHEMIRKGMNSEEVSIDDALSYDRM